MTVWHTVDLSGFPPAVRYLPRRRGLLCCQPRRDFFVAGWL